jgi:hypothetical protein
MTHSRKIQQIADDIEAALSGRDETGASEVAAHIQRAVRSAVLTPRLPPPGPARPHALCSHTLRDQAVLEAEIFSAMYDYIATIRCRAAELELRGY